MSNSHNRLHSSPSDTTPPLEQATDLLARCHEGFSAFVHGRKMSRADRDKLRADISDFLNKHGHLK